jgi:hypothetical protein
MSMSPAMAELGPVMPPRGEVYRKAREVRDLVQLAAEAATLGPRCDVMKAAAYLDRARAVLGSGA